MLTKQSLPATTSRQRLPSVPAQPVASLAMDAEGRVLFAAVNGVGIFKGVKR